MAKPFVTDPQGRTRVPFLRGILTRSLQDAGLDFDDAYRLADSVRQELDEATEISTEDLRRLVQKRLQAAHGEEVARDYVIPATSPRPLTVRGFDGAVSDFSRSLHQRHLRSCGLQVDQAHLVTAEIYEQLLAEEPREVDSQQVALRTWRLLRDAIGPESARRYLVWTGFLRSGRPLLLLIGGATGSGKSTIATEIAHHLEIVRVQSTDMLREVMRPLVPKRLNPALHRSTYNAWQALPALHDQSIEMDTLIQYGYRAQAQLLALPTEAVIKRALSERVSLIVEGIHVHPEILKELPRDDDAIVVMLMLAVLDPDGLQNRIRGRSRRAPKRRAERYLRNFESIWALQSYLLSEADRCGAPIIPNDRKEATLQRVMSTVIDQIARECPVDANALFGTALKADEVAAK